MWLENSVQHITVYVSYRIVGFLFVLMKDETISYDIHVQYIIHSPLCSSAFMTARRYPIASSKPGGYAMEHTGCGPSSCGIG